MSSVKTQSRYDGSRHLNFITTAPWQSFFKTYTFNGPSPANNFTGSGALSAVLNTSGVAVTATDCPAGRILRTNGKKLYPDAAALDLTAYPDRTPLIGVFDYHSGLSGFIDPNATVFAIYNVDKPIDSLDGTAASGANNHRGMSVYTGGSVTVGTQIRLTSGTSVIPYAATTSPYNFSTTLTSFYSFTPAAAVTISASAVPISGTLVTIFYSAAGSFTVTHGGSFSATGNIPLTSSAAFVVSYVSNGTTLVEVSRSATFTTAPTPPVAV